MNRARPLDVCQRIGTSVSATKQRLRRERLAARAAAAAEAATADLRPAFAYSSGLSTASGGESGGESEGEYDYDFEGEEEDEFVVLDMLELEKSVIELTSLRRQIANWMNAYEKKYGKKPNLTEASEEHPMVYARFVRYVALRELVRRSSLAIGQSPVVY